VTATRMGVLALGAALALAAGATTQGARTVGSACDPSGQLVGRTVVFCGPATARVSIFPGVVFEDGSCMTRKVNGVAHFTLSLGARTQTRGRMAAGRTSA
jgi:hypothetical protein